MGQYRLASCKQAIEADRKFIIGNGPEAAGDFGNKVLEAIKENLE